MSNFQFLESHWTDLAKLGDLSEKYVYSDIVNIGLHFILKNVRPYAAPCSEA